MSHQKSKTVVITNETGMHCRPSASFVKVASQFQSEVLVQKDGEVVDGKSIFGLMMLAIGKGSEIEILASGPDAILALDTLEKLVKSDFNLEDLNS